MQQEEPEHVPAVVQQDEGCSEWDDLELFGDRNFSKERERSIFEVWQNLFYVKKQLNDSIYEFYHFEVGFEVGQLDWGPDPMRSSGHRRIGRALVPHQLVQIKVKQHLVLKGVPIPIPTLLDSAN